MLERIKMSDLAWDQQKSFKMCFGKIKVDSKIFELVQEWERLKWLFFNDRKNFNLESFLTLQKKNCKIISKFRKICHSCVSIFHKQR